MQWAGTLESTDHIVENACIHINGVGPIVNNRVAGHFHNAKAAVEIGVALECYAGRGSVKHNRGRVGGEDDSAACPFQSASGAGDIHRGSAVNQEMVSGLDRSIK